MTTVTTAPEAEYWLQTGWMEEPGAELGIRKPVTIDRKTNLHEHRAYWCVRRAQDIFFSLLALIALLLLLPLCRWPLLTMLTLYGALDLFFAAKSALEAPRGKLLTFICLPFLFPIVHIVYGAGTLCGLLAGKAQPHA